MGVVVGCRNVSGQESSADWLFLACVGVAMGRRPVCDKLGAQGRGSVAGGLDDTEMRTEKIKNNTKVPNRALML